MKTYTSLLHELKIECQFQVDTHIRRFKEEVSKGRSSREAYDSISNSCTDALTSAGTNLLHKSMGAGVDDDKKLIEGVESVTRDYTKKFISAINDYLR